LALFLIEFFALSVGVLKNHIMPSEWEAHSGHLECSHMCSSGIMQIPAGNQQVNWISRRCGSSGEGCVCATLLLCLISPYTSLAQVDAPGASALKAVK